LKPVFIIAIVFSITIALVGVVAMTNTVDDTSAAKAAEARAVADKAAAEARAVADKAAAKAAEARAAAADTAAYNAAVAKAAEARAAAADTAAYNAAVAKAAGDYSSSAYKAAGAIVAADRAGIECPAGYVGSSGCPLYNKVAEAPAGDDGSSALEWREENGLPYVNLPPLSEKYSNTVPEWSPRNSDNYQTLEKVSPKEVSPEEAKQRMREILGADTMDVIERSSDGKTLPDVFIPPYIPPSTSGAPQQPPHWSSQSPPPLPPHSYNAPPVQNPFFP